ncbi:MAG: GNAT family N-acetyltransferase, partial [Alphaproteobacteria bacterium]|nr:GNAT family N-acetyltransferase [Alphaproteobacteria bacterium]
YHTVLLDLTVDEDVLSKGLHGKWRNRLKASEKAEMTITPMSKRPDKYAWLLEKEGNQQKTLRYQSQDAAITQRYHAILGKGSILAFEAKQGVERIGGMLFLRHGDDATYHIGWASDKGKELNVHNRLLWHAIKTLKKAGIRTLDLGGVNTDYNPGIARFKIGTGGRVLSLSGAWTKGPRWK